MSISRPSNPSTSKPLTNEPGERSRAPRLRPTANQLAEVDTVDRTKSSATRRTNQDQEQARLKELEERYRHELLSDEERQELRDRVLKLRRRLDR